MSLTTYAFIHQSDDVAFDDLTKLNDELQSETGIGDLTEKAVGDPDYKGFLELDSPNDLKMAIFTDGEFDGEYGTDYCMVYSYMDKTICDKIAEHMTAGKIVVRVEIEGNETEFFIMTPGVVNHKTMSDVRF